MYPCLSSTIFFCFLFAGCVGSPKTQTYKNIQEPKCMAHFFFGTKKWTVRQRTPNTSKKAGYIPQINSVDIDETLKESGAITLNEPLSTRQQCSACFLFVLHTPSASEATTVVSYPRVARDSDFTIWHIQHTAEGGKAEDVTRG